MSTIKTRYADYIDRLLVEENIDISGYSSVTEFINKYQDGFPTKFIAGKVAGKSEHTPTAEDVLEMWDLKGDIGKDWGNALHKTFELWFQYNERPKNMLVSGFIDKLEELGFEQSKGRPEIRVRSHKQKLVGTIDLVYVEDEEKREVSIWDYKTYNDLSEKKDSYLTGIFKPKKKSLEFSTTIQLTLYKLMLESEGYTVVKMGIIQQKDTELIKHIVEPDMDSVKALLDFEIPENT